jgi:guanylate kinase
LTVNNYLGNKYGFLRADLEKLRHSNLVTINHYKNAERLREFVPNIFCAYIMPQDIKKTFAELNNRPVSSIETTLRGFDCMQELNWVSRPENQKIFNAVHKNRYDQNSVTNFRELVQRAIML